MYDFFLVFSNWLIYKFLRKGVKDSFHRLLRTTLLNRPAVYADGIREIDIEQLANGVEVFGFGRLLSSLTVDDESCFIKREEDADKVDF